MNFIKTKSMPVMLLLGILLINTACTSASVSTQTEVAPNLETSQASKILNPQDNTKLSAFTSLAEINELEMAFVNKNCDKVLELAKNLGISVTEQALLSIPPLSALAIVTCEAKLNSQDNLKIQLAGKIYDTVFQKTNHVYNNEFFEIFPYGSSALINQKISAEVSPQIRQLLEQIIIDSHSQAGLVGGLQKLENLATEPLGIETRALLLQLKANMIGKLETPFFVDIQKLEEKKLFNIEAAKKDGEEIKQRFPFPIYAARVDAIIAGNTMILQSPTLPANGAPQAGAGTPLSDALNPDKIMQDAKAAIDAGDAERALGILSTMPEKNINDKTKRLKKEASEQHIKELRLRVREIYSRISKQPSLAKEGKIEGLKQCKTILELILSKYPDTASKPGIERNLKSIINELDFTAKEQ